MLISRAACRSADPLPRVGLQDRGTPRTSTPQSFNPSTLTTLPSSLRRSLISQHSAWDQQVSLPRCAHKTPYLDAHTTHTHTIIVISRALTVSTKTKRKFKLTTHLPKQTILIPAAIALSIYILASCVIIPFFRRYHQRYSQYLPLHSISAHTLSLRDRIADKVMHFFLPSRWRWGAHVADHDTESIGDEEGEVLVGMDMDSVRRGTLQQQRRDNRADTQSRLSRDLEEGFMDDSDSEGSERRGHGRGERL